MNSFTLHLKDEFPFLGENGKDPRVEIMLPYNMTEMHRENQKRPCMVVCPGGGYGGCSQREAEPIGLHFLPDGYNVLTLYYSCAPNRFPTQLVEVAAVMELIYRHADEWNCDTNRVAIIGFSAGGHLAAHYSTCYDCAEVRQIFPDSKGVQATVLGYPVITADSRYCNLGSFRNLSGHDTLSDEEVECFSCERHVTDHTPPAYIFHTSNDRVVPVMNAFLYAEALHDHNVPVEVHVYPKGEHGLATADDATCGELPADIARCAAWMAEARQWLKHTL